MKRFLNPILALILMAAMGSLSVSCTITDNPIDSGSAPATPEVTEFYNETVNKMIEENYTKVLSDGYAELRIPASLYPKDMIKMPAADMETMDIVVKAGYTAFLNGGAVRDGVLGKELHDVDFSTDATPDELVATVPNSHKTQAGNLTIAQAEHEDGMRTDMVTYRAIDSRLVGKPGIPATEYTSDKSPYSKNLLDDSFGRDLTINAIYYDYKTGDIIDYHGGLRDLREKIIRTPMEPNLAFTIDPQSILRAVRFAARYEFTVEENTAKAIVDNLPKVEVINPALRRYVVMKGFADGCAFRTYQYNVKYGVLGFLAPMLKDYIGKTDYEVYLKTAFDYIDAQKGMNPSLAYAILFMPAVMDELGDKEPTRENITAAFDKLEQGSGQDKTFWLEDFSFTKKDPITIWRLYRLMTDEATQKNQQLIEDIKTEYTYNGTLLLLNALAANDETLKKYADFWNKDTETGVTDLAKLTADYTAKDGDVLTGQTSFRVIIPEGAKVMLKGAQINNTLRVEGNATIILAKNATNIVNCEDHYGAAINVVADKTLTIQGSADSEIIAQGGIEGAGIGGNGSIVIEGGQIMALGGIGGAGIGGDLYSPSGDITITGGEIAAYGGDEAAGIGSGQDGQCGKITIKKSVTSVLAEAGSECENAIGAGQGGTCGEISIEEGAYVVKQTASAEK